MLWPEHFSQQILSVKLLLTIIGAQKSNFNNGFELELLTT